MKLHVPIALRYAGKTIWFLVKIVWATYQITLGAALILALLFAVSVLDTFHWFDIRNLQKKNPATTAFIEAERERLREETGAGGKSTGREKDLITWTWVAGEKIPLMVKTVAIIAEDGKFREHSGFDLEQIEYAMVANRQRRSSGRVRGASTITQQVVKNLYLNSDRNYERKAKEAAMTLMLEQYLTKDRILEIYLNVAQFGPGLFGIETAARHFYHKSVSALSFDEAVSLIALLPSPEKWSPGCGYRVYARHQQRIRRNYMRYAGIKDRMNMSEEDALSEFNLQDETERWGEFRDREDVVADSTQDPGAVAGPDSLPPGGVSPDSGSGQD